MARPACLSWVGDPGTTWELTQQMDSKQTCGISASWLKGIEVPRQLLIKGEITSYLYKPLHSKYLNITAMHSPATAILQIHPAISLIHSHGQLEDEED